MSGTRIAACAAALLAGCAHVAPVPIGAARPLAPPGALPARSAQQTVRAFHGARTVTLRTAVLLDAGALVVVGLTATGQRLFTVNWNGVAVVAERSPFVPADLDPHRMLADMQLALWPLESLQQAFRGSGFEVSEPFSGMRRLQRGDMPVAEVHYASTDPWNGRLWIVNFEFNYSLAVDSTQD
jgi:hypothetical protein